MWLQTSRDSRKETIEQTGCLTSDADNAHLSPSLSFKEVYTFAFIHYLLVVEGEVFSRTRNVATPYITPILLGESCSVCLCVCVSVYAPTSTQLSSPDAAARCSGVFRAWWERARDIANLVSGVWELYHQFPGSSPQLLDCCCAIPKAGRPANISAYQLMIIFFVWLLHIVYIVVVWASDVRLCVASMIACDTQAGEKLIVNSGMPHDNSDYTITPLRLLSCTDCAESPWGLYLPAGHHC